MKYSFDFFPNHLNMLKIIPILWNVQNKQLNEFGQRV